VDAESKKELICLVSNAHVNFSSINRYRTHNNSVLLKL
jgi:hypothetical protein